MVEPEGAGCAGLHGPALDFEVAVLDEVLGFDGGGGEGVEALGEVGEVFSPGGEVEFAVADGDVLGGEEAGLATFPSGVVVVPLGGVELVAFELVGEFGDGLPLGTWGRVGQGCRGKGEGEECGEEGECEGFLFWPLVFLSWLHLPTGKIRGCL